MKLKYTGDFEKLKEYGFELDGSEWFKYYDETTGYIIYILPISKLIYLYNSSGGRRCVPTIIFDLIKDGYVEKVVDHSEE